MGAVKERTPALQETSPVKCRHHWLIEEPSGPLSRGVCKHCGAVRDFKNYVETPYWTRNEPPASPLEPLSLEADLSGEAPWDE